MPALPSAVRPARGTHTPALTTACAALALLALPVAPAAARAQQPVPLRALSDLTNAGYSDIAAGPYGTLHAVWQDRRGSEAAQLFYRSSRDGGASWGALAQLSETTNSQPVGIPRVVVDGSGRVYALWKELDVGVGTMLHEENAATPSYGTLRYRALTGTRWSRIEQLGPARAVLSWYPTVDGAGRAHVVWSENPGGASIMSTPKDGGAVRQAQLDGGSAAAARVVFDDRDGGWWALNGYLDARGQPRFVAMRRPRSGEAQVILWDGARATIVGTPDGSEDRGTPQLVRDAAGADHILYLDPRASTIVDMDVAARKSDVVYRLPDAAGVLSGFQARGFSGGRVVVTVQARSRRGTSGPELFVLRSENGRWAPAVNVTDNASRGRVSGYIATDGSSLGHGTEWAALHASAAFDHTGGLNLLVTNVRSSTTTNTQVSAVRRYTFGGSWSYPQVFFARLGGGTLRGTVAQAEPPPRGTHPANGPAPRQGQPANGTGPATPAPTPAAQPGLPTGRYVCHYIAQYVGPLDTGSAVEILDGGRYTGTDGRAGTYRLERAGGPVQWLTGPFADRSTVARFTREDGRPAFQVSPAGGSDDARRNLTCVLK